MTQVLSDRALDVLQLASREAQRLRHEYVGTEHILLGLIDAPYSGAAVILKSLSMDLRKIRSEIDLILQSGPDPVTIGPTGRLPETPRTRQVIQFAKQEAARLGHSRVGTEHLLVGLMHTQEGVAAQVLMHLGLRPEALLEQVAAITEPN
jgi:ATP-dependent Clp protease ATP-binding subunit ClpC